LGGVPVRVANGSGYGGPLAVEIQSVTPLAMEGICGSQPRHGLLAT